LAVLGIAVLGLARLRRSRFGRALIMTGADPEAAAVVGVSPWRYRVAAFGVAGLLAGIAGALSTPLFFTPPGDSQYIAFNSVFYLAVPVLAGFDSIGGVVAVAVVLTLLPQVLLDARLNVYLLGGLAMAAGALLGPRGFGGLVPRRRRAAPALAGARPS
jgi:branched-chain amino acid transport system permease protein